MLGQSDESDVNIWVSHTDGISSNLNIEGFLPLNIKDFVSGYRWSIIVLDCWGIDEDDDIFKDNEVANATISMKYRVILPFDNKVKSLYEILYMQSSLTSMQVDVFDL